MPKYKQTTIENPEKFEKPIYQDFNYHRSFFYKWEFMETIIYGNHNWNFYKPLSREIKIDVEYPKYFSDYEMYKKQLLNLCKTVFPTNWLPLDKLYISGLYGTIDVVTTDKTYRKIDFTKEDDRKFFKTKNVLTTDDFLRWILLIAVWENIDCTQTIIKRFYFLFEKFKIYYRTDMTPSMVAMYFNKKLESIKTHNIEPINSIQIFEYYKFIMHPEVYSISVRSALDKLFYLVERSNFLKGHESNFKPSFMQYYKFLEKIFAGNYSSGYKNNIVNIKRLDSSEVHFFDFDDAPKIKSDLVIPDHIIEKYSLLDKPKKIEPTEVTKEERLIYLKKVEDNKLENKKTNLEKITAILNKYSSETLNRKQTKAEKIKEKTEKALKKLK